MTVPASIALLEFDSIALGTRAADAMVKKAPLAAFRAGTISREEARKQVEVKEQ